MSGERRVLVFGSYGAVLLDGAGEVLEGSGYSDITKFDVEEYVKWLEAKVPAFLPETSLIEADIEEMGYWVEDKFYPPNTEFRDRVEKLSIRDSVITW